MVHFLAENACSGSYWASLSVFRSEVWLVAVIAFPIRCSDSHTLWYVPCPHRILGPFGPRILLISSARHTLFIGFSELIAVFIWHCDLQRFLRGLCLSAHFVLRVLFRKFKNKNVPRPFSFMCTQIISRCRSTEFSVRILQTLPFLLFPGYHLTHFVCHISLLLEGGYANL